MLAIAFATGCGDDAGMMSPDPEIPADTAHSGSRIKLAWYDMADGTSTWASPFDLYDAELAVACTPTRWADGVVRCTPTTRGYFYSDASCTHVVLPSDARFGIDGGVISCSDGVKEGAPDGMLLVGSGETMYVPTIYGRDGAGGCRSQSSGGLVQTLSEVRPASSLVTLSYGYQGMGPLAIKTLLGEDGLIVPVQPYDRGLRAGCGLAALDRATELPCLVSEPNLERVFTDENCTQPGIRTQDDCEPPTIASLSRGCSGYYSVGRQAVESSYEEHFNVCFPGRTDPGPAYPLIDRIDPVWMTRAPVPGAGRGQPIYVGTGDVHVREPEVVFDSALMTECRFGPVKDGETTHCTPDGNAFESDVYADSACTQPLALVQAWHTDTCRAQPPPTVTSMVRPRRIGEIHVGDVYEGPPGICSKSFNSWYDVGDEIGVDRLTAVKRRDL